MTRGLVAKLAANALGLSTDAGTYGTFTDTDSPYVEALCAAGIVGGYPDGTFSPGRVHLPRGDRRDRKPHLPEPRAVVACRTMTRILTSDPSQIASAHDRADDRAAQIRRKASAPRPTGIIPSIPSATAAPARRTNTPTASPRRRPTSCCARCCRGFEDKAGQVPAGKLHLTLPRQPV